MLRQVLGIMILLMQANSGGMMEEKKKMPVFVAALIILILILAVGGLWYVFTAAIESKFQDYNDTYTPEEEIGTLPEQLPMDGYDAPTDDMFEFVNIDDYNEDVTRLNVLINCQYNGTYNWDAILNREQSDYILYSLMSEFPDTGSSVDITPTMNAIISEMEDIIFTEAILILPSGLSDDDLCEEPVEEEVSTEEEESQSVDITFPDSYYVCMQTEDCKLANELDRSKLISVILGDNPRLSYNADSGRWSIVKSDVDDGDYQLFNYTIYYGNPLEQMKGLSQYEFKYDSLRVYEDYLLFSVYRGAQHLNLKFQKSGDIYKIMNVNDFINALIDIVS